MLACHAQEIRRFGHSGPVPSALLHVASVSSRKGGTENKRLQLPILSSLN